MPLELEELKEMHDKAFTYNQTTREDAANDLIFYWITHWDDSALEDSQLSYRGEFDILRKAGRQILADLAENEVQVDFEPKDIKREDAAEVLDGLYRSDDAKNLSIESYDVARQEAVVCGIGAWELVTEYESLKGDDNRQVIKRYPVHEANNTVFWDPNARLLDKSDADYCSLLCSYTPEGYVKLVEELTGEIIDSPDADSFSTPEHSYKFPWIGSNGKIIYISKFYHRELVTDKILTMVDPFLQEITLRESTLEDVMDDLLDQGFSIKSTKEVKRYQVTRYIASGLEILSSDVVAGENIPVIPLFGERAFIENEEHYEGVTRLAKDPQRLRDFQLSYLADIVSRSPRQKPIFWPEQIQGHEDMYAESGSESNYPYLLQNKRTPTGEELPIGPIAVMPEQPIPTALVTSIELSRQAVEDVANPGLPQDIADPDISGKAVLALQARLDMQSMVYQKRMKHAKRRDGEVYASMASEVYDVPREVTLTLADGTKKTSTVMQTVLDAETGDIVVINDLNGVEFDITSTIGPSYNTQKDQTIDRLDQMSQTMDPADPAKRILMLKSLKLMDGIDFSDIRDYANMELVKAGVRKPQTPEEQQAFQAAQQAAQQPSPEMVLAQAEMLKGKADILKEKREVVKMQMEHRNEGMKRRIDSFEAQTDRMDTQIDAAVAGVKIDHEKIEAFGKQLENIAAMLELSIGGIKAEKDLSGVPDAELFQQLGV